MTLLVTQQMALAYEDFLNETVDTTLDGIPITRRSTMAGMEYMGFVPFCHGFQRGYDFGYMKGECDDYNS